MTATDKLRKLLDGRGVEYKKRDPMSDLPSADRETRWGRASYREWPSGTTRFGATGTTPEQAIAATLGTGKCNVDVLNTGDCAGYECSEYIMHCNGCGREFGHVLYNEDGDVWMSEVPNFCPNCGRKVVRE